MALMAVWITQKLDATDTREAKTLWYRVGTAFPHKQGSGFNIEFIPGISVSGNIVILPIKDKGDDNHAPTPLYGLDNLPS